MNPLISQLLTSSQGKSSNPVNLQELIKRLQNPPTAAMPFSGPSQAQTGNDTTSGFQGPVDVNTTGTGRTTNAGEQEGLAFANALNWGGKGLDFAGKGTGLLAMMGQNQGLSGLTQGLSAAKSGISLPLSLLAKAIQMGVKGNEQARSNESSDAWQSTINNSTPGEMGAMYNSDPSSVLGSMYGAMGQPGYSGDGLSVGPMGLQGTPMGNDYSSWGAY